MIQLSWVFLNSYSCHQEDRLKAESSEAMTVNWAEDDWNNCSHQSLSKQSGTQHETPKGQRSTSTRWHFHIDFPSLGLGLFLLLPKWYMGEEELQEL